MGLLWEGARDLRLSGEGEFALAEIDGDSGDARGCRAHQAVEVVACVSEVVDHECGLVAELCRAEGEAGQADWFADGFARLGPPPPPASAAANTDRKRTRLN